jgi:hypothetical protein
MEYVIHKDRPGLLGDVATFLGLMGVNITMINGIASHKRGLLLSCSDPSRVVTLKNAMARASNIELTAFRRPNFIDRINLKHGKIVRHDPDKPDTYAFVRDELGMLVDFLGELLSKQKPIIGLRGMPRVGKTEASIASCVHANKKWVLVSSTLMRQVMRRSLLEDEKHSDCVYIIDGIVSGIRGTKEHKELVLEVLESPVPKIIEHPDIFLRELELDPGFLDYTLELRRSENEIIDYQLVSQSFSAFDIS